MGQQSTKLGGEIRSQRLRPRAPYAIWLAMSTALHRGEIFKIKCENVGLSLHELIVQAETVKFNTIRILPLDDWVLAVFKEVGDVRHISR